MASTSDNAASQVEPPGSDPRGYSSAYRPADGTVWTPYDLAEVNPNLSWPANIPVYSQMRQDAQIDAAVGGHLLTLVKAAWRVDPGDADDDIVQSIADDFGLPILGDEAATTPSATRLAWKSHLQESLDCMMTYGHAPYEITVELRNGIYRLAGLGIRLPGTITRVPTYPDGRIKFIRQAGTADIPGDSVLWYKTGGFGAVPQGVSLLRPSYKHWFLRDFYERKAAQQFDRAGVVVPTVLMPAGATQEQTDEAMAIAATYRGGDDSGISLPYGAKLELVGVSGSMPDPLPRMHYHDGQIAKSLRVSFFELGSSSKGSHSLGEVLIDVYRDGAQALGDDFAEQTTEQYCKRIAEWSRGEGTPYPRIVMGKIGEDSNLPPEALAMLVEAGIITADADLEAWVRDTYGAPALADLSEHINPVAKVKMPTTTGAPGGTKADAPGSANFSAARPKAGAVLVAAADSATDRRKEGKDGAAATAAIAAHHSSAVALAIKGTYPTTYQMAAQANDGWDPDTITDPQKYTTELLAGLTVAAGLVALQGALSTVHSEAAKVGAESAATETGTAVVTDGERLAAIQEQLTTWVSSIDDTTRERMATALADGLSNGDSVHDLASALGDILGDVDRADMIAETEARRAYIDAKMDTFQAGGVSELYWDQGEHCEDCTANQDASPISIDDDWPNGDPPVHPNCTCDIFATAEDSSDPGANSDSGDGE